MAKILHPKTSGLQYRCNLISEDCSLNRVEVRLPEIEIHWDRCVLTEPHDHDCAEASNPDIKPKKHQKD